MSWTLTRRDLLKAGFTTAAVGATGVPLSALGAEEPKDWRWDRGVCRFCGVGCGIQVATAGGRVVAVKGDPASPVNRGLLCVKGYANARDPLRRGPAHPPAPPHEGRASSTRRATSCR